MLTIVALLAAGPTFLMQADPWTTLQPGHWMEIPSSRIRTVVPNPAPPGNPANVVNAWSGAAFDTRRNRFIVFGGGHGDYSGNEIYVFDIATNLWSRPWGPSPNIPPGPITCGETYADGNPRSRHTYAGLNYLPAVDRFWVYGGSLY